MTFFFTIYLFIAYSYGHLEYGIKGLGRFWLQSYVPNESKSNTEYVFFQFDQLFYHNFANNYGIQSSDIFGDII